MLAVLLVALIVLTNSTSYQVHAVFADASGLVSGDDVLIGPARVGTVSSVGLSRTGQAVVLLDVGDGVAPLHRGTVARIAENGLAGIASHYVVLQPGPGSRPAIPSGGTIPRTDTYAEVSLDQLFDTLDPLTRAGLRNLIRGEAAGIRGRAAQANSTLHYLAPALQSTGEVTAELARSEPRFDALLVQGGRTMQALASRGTELTQLVAATAQSTGAIAAQSASLRDALSRLPGALSHSTRTFAGLRATLGALDPLVAASKPASRRLGRFAVALARFEQVSLPTLGELVGLIHAPNAGGDLTALLAQTPALARQAGATFPRLIAEMNDSQAQLDYLREYAPDVVAALGDLGQAGANYDANGHYARTQPVFGAFGLSAANQLVPQPPADRYSGLRVVHGRCPGGAVGASPDQTAPLRVAGCDPSSSPSGS